MKIKTVLMERMAPVLENYGYTMEVLGRLHYAFSTKNDSRVINIDTQRLFPNMLRFYYNVNGKNSFILNLNDFNAEFCYVSQLTYSNHEELEHYIDEVTKATVTIINPYLDIMEENYVTRMPEMYVALAESTGHRAREFAHRWNLSMEPRQENIKKLNDIMSNMKKNISKRKEEFFLNKDELINLTAYYGELMSIEWDKPGCWEWRKIAENRIFYAVQANGYDVLGRIIWAWNFGSETYGLKGF